MIKGPILDNSRKGANPSVKGMKHALMIAQTYVFRENSRIVERLTGA
jgi:hypothetical protein